MASNPSKCHPSRNYFACGRCRECYEADFAAGLLPDRAATCHPDRPIYIKGLCWECVRPNIVRRNWNRRSNSEAFSNEELEKLVTELLVTQSGVCAICGRPETQQFRGTLRVLDLDHNHDTDEPRGLLCSKCNRGIGMFDDDPVVVAAALQYLQKYSVETTSPSPVETEGPQLSVSHQLFTGGIDG